MSAPTVSEYPNIGWVQTLFSLTVFHPGSFNKSQLNNQLLSSKVVLAGPPMVQILANSAMNIEQRFSKLKLQNCIWLEVRVSGIFCAQVENLGSGEASYGHYKGYCGGDPDMRGTMMDTLM